MSGHPTGPPEILPYAFRLTPRLFRGFESPIEGLIHLFFRLTPDCARYRPPNVLSMRLLRHIALASCVIAFSSAVRVVASEIVLKPAGRILYQPQLLWSNSMSTVQGTGYVIRHGEKYFGVTSLHFLDFDAGGLRSATWLDVFNETPLATFRASLGKPIRASFTLPRHVADDFLLLPLTTLPEGGTALQLEQVERYSPGERLWFPNKNRDVEIGHEWIDATIIEDAGHLIKVRVRDPIVLQSQSGSPLLNASTGKVVGMIHGGNEEDGKIILTLCPARSLVKHLGRRQQLSPLMTSISRRR